jgi:hypothetical protein
MKKIPRPPLLEPEFEETFKTVQDVAEYVVDTPSKQTILSKTLPSSLNLIQIGDGVHATNSISPTASTSIENDTKNCLDQLLCTTPTTPSRPFSTPINSSRVAIS